MSIISLSDKYKEKNRILFGSGSAIEIRIKTKRIRNTDLTRVHNKTSFDNLFSTVPGLHGTF